MKAPVARLVPVRERLTAGVLLLNDAGLRKLERDRKLLETAMQQQLGLRARMAAVEAQNPAEAKELRVRLRLVKSVVSPRLLESARPPEDAPRSPRG